MDKLKRVLSGRDAEEPSGLAEVTNARLPPAPASLPEPGRRRGEGCVPEPGRRLPSGGRRERSGGGPGPPLSAAAVPPSAGPACAASARRWASGSPGRSRPGTAVRPGAALRPFSLALKIPRVLPREQPPPVGREPWLPRFARGDDSVSGINLGRPGRGRLLGPGGGWLPLSSSRASRGRGCVGTGGAVCARTRFSSLASK